MLFLGLFFPFLVFADTVAAQNTALSSGYMAKLLLSLGLVVGIIFALAWVVKRFNFVPQQGRGIIQIISTLSVGSRDRIALIQVGEEQLLIAVSPGRITKLHSLEKPIQTLNAKTLEEGSFKDKLNTLLNKDNQSSTEEKT